MQNNKPHLRPRNRRSQRTRNVGPLGQSSLVFRPGRYGQPLPRDFVTKFWCEADYKIAIATASLTSGSTKLNAVDLPLRPGGSSGFPSFTFLGPATESTLNPTGFSQLFASGLYTTYKVLASTIKIKVSGANSGNNLTCVIVPTDDSTTVSDIYQARTMPWAKSGSFSVSKPNTGCDRDGWLTNSIDPGTLNGLTRLQFAADDQLLTVNPGSTPAIGQLWRVFLQSNDLDVSSTTASLFQVRLHWTVQCYQIAKQSLTLIRLQEHKQETTDGARVESIPVRGTSVIEAPGDTSSFTDQCHTCGRRGGVEPSGEKGK